MSSIFSCDWIVQRPKIHNTASTVNTILAAHECRLFFTSTRIGETGCYTKTCLWVVPSSEILDICLERILPYFKFSTYFPTDAKQLGEKTWNAVFTNIFGYNAEESEIYGQYNEAIFQNSYMWSQCYWTAKPLTNSDLDSVFNLIDKWSYSLRFSSPEYTRLSAMQPHFDFLFYLRARPISRDLFIGEIQPFIYLQVGEWLREASDFIRHCPVLDVNQLSQMKPFSLENSTEFLALANYYGHRNEANKSHL